MDASWQFTPDTSSDPADPPVAILLDDRVCSLMDEPSHRPTCAAQMVRITLRTRWPRTSGQVFAKCSPGRGTSILGYPGMFPGRS